MFDSDLPIDCATCVASGTTACGDCVVAHLLANDDGPIEFVVAPVVSLKTPIDRAIALFAAAGLLDDPPAFVSYDEFEVAASGAPLYADGVRQPDPLPSLAEITALMAKVDVTHVGVASVEILTETRQALHARKAAGLHDEMGFTYRNPDRSTDPGRAVEGAKSIIVAARPYLTDDDPRPPPPDAGPHARVGRYAWVDHYAPLRAGLWAVARLIRRAGDLAVVYADDNSIVDRAVAHRGGLGWYGKNTNLLLPGAGSFFVLGCLITTAEYEAAAAPVDDACGTCTKCIEGCPTGAIIEPGVIDAAKCLSWVLQKPGPIPHELRAAVGDRIYGCDDCQDVCPITVRLGARNTVPLADDAEAWVDAVRLLDADDDEIERRYGRWYIAGREMRWLRRNALIVIGNIGDPTDRRVRSVVADYRSHDDPILAEHADWAEDRLDART